MIKEAAIPPLVQETVNLVASDVQRATETGPVCLFWPPESPTTCCSDTDKPEGNHRGLLKEGKSRLDWQRSHQCLFRRNESWKWEFKAGRARNLLKNAAFRRFSLMLAADFNILLGDDS